MLTNLTSLCTKQMQAVEIIITYLYHILSYFICITLLEYVHSLHYKEIHKLSSYKTIVCALEATI